MRKRYRSLRSFYVWRNRPECPNHKWFAKEKDFEVRPSKWGGNWYRCLLCLKRIPDLKQKNKEYEQWAKETLQDSYLLKMILKGTKLFYWDIPQELIKLERLRFQIKRSIKEQKEK